MKKIFLLLCCLGSITVSAQEYRTLSVSHDIFRGHGLYPLFVKVVNSNNLVDAQYNWESFIDSTGNHLA